MDVVPPYTWWYTLVPLIIGGAAVLGVIFLIVLGILASRRVTVSLRTGGAVTLTLASIILLSGLWCVFLSPTITHSETKESLYRNISISGSGNWSYSISMQERNTLMVSVSRDVRDSDIAGKVYRVYVYDPDGTVVRSETTTTYAQINLRALESGVYKVEAQNPNQQDIEFNVQIIVSAEVTYRPLEPLGQWLSLISIPIFGLGMWSSGLLAVLQKKPEKRPSIVA